MSGELGKIEIEILEALYKREYEEELEFELDYKRFSLRGDALSSQEFGYYIDKLRRRNYIDCEDSAIIRTYGPKNRYNSNVGGFLWGNINIMRKGKNFVEENRLKAIDKIKKWFVGIHGYRMKNYSKQN